MRAHRTLVHARPPAAQHSYISAPARTDAASEVMPMKMTPSCLYLCCSSVKCGMDVRHGGHLPHRKPPIMSHDPFEGVELNSGMRQEFIRTRSPRTPARTPSHAPTRQGRP